MISMDSRTREHFGDTRRNERMWVNRLWRKWAKSVKGSRGSLSSFKKKESLKERERERIKSDKERERERELKARVIKMRLFTENDITLKFRRNWKSCKRFSRENIIERTTRIELKRKRNIEGEKVEGEKMDWNDRSNTSLQNEAKLVQ